MKNGLWNKIKESINLQEYVGTTVETQRRGNLLFCLSPFVEETNPSCCLYPDHFHCYSSGEHGDIFDWIARTRNVELIEALRIAAQYAGIAIDEETETRLVEEARKRAEWQKRMDDGIANRNERFYEWLHSRGLSDDTIDLFRLGYDPEHDAITIPILDAGGRALSITLRRIEGDPKYQHFNTPFITFSEHLFNWQVAVEADAPVYIVEGQFDVMALYEAGVYSGVCTYGELFSSKQVKLLLSHFGTRPIVMVPDKDEANVEEHAKRLARNIHLVRAMAPDIDLRIIDLPSNDANATLVEKGKDALLEALKAERPIDMFLLEKALEEADTREAEYIAAQRIVKATQNAMIQDDMIRALADRWDKSIESVGQYVLGTKQKNDSAYIKRGEEIIDNYEQYVDSLANPVFVFPWPSLNERIRAVTPGHVLAFIARTSVGKTVWGLNLIERCMCNNPDTHVMLFTFEQPDIEIAARLMGMQSEHLGDPNFKVNPRDLELICQNREVSSEWKWRRDIWVEQFKNLSVVENIMPVEAIEASINDASIKYGKVDVVVLDYLGLISAVGTEYEQISNVAKAIKTIAKRTRTFFVYLHQLSRRGEDGSTPVTLDMARGSGVIEESVDYLLGAWRPNGTDSPEFEVAILKNRHGPTGQGSFEMNMRTLALVEKEEMFDIPEYEPFKEDE